MKSFLLIAAGISCFFSVKSQVANDTIYFNKNWKKTTKDSSRYYRLLNKEGKLFRVTDYFNSGNIQMKGQYSSLNPDMKQGKFIYYSEVGYVMEEKNYRKDKLDGENITYYPASRKIWLLDHYKKGKRNGDFMVYYENGNVRRRDIYKKGAFKGGKCYTETGQDTTFYPFEQMPMYRGGQNALLEYLAKHTTYPKDARDADREGTVYVQFAVSKTGNVEQVKVLRSVYPSLDAEALRVVQSMPSWEPGQQDGKAVSVFYTVPIHFNLR